MTATIRVWKNAVGAWFGDIVVGHGDGKPEVRLQSAATFSSRGEAVTTMTNAMAAMRAASVELLTLAEAPE